MLTRLTAVGTVGSLLIAVSTWWVGAVPHSFQDSPPDFIGWLPVSSAGPRAVFYIGLTVLVGAWLVLGRQLLSSSKQLSRQRLIFLVIAWSVPMIAAMPIDTIPASK